MLDDLELYLICRGLSAICLRRKEMSYKPLENIYTDISTAINKKENISFHEIIRGRCKVYLDLDEKIDITREKNYKEIAKEKSLDILTKLYKQLNNFEAHVFDSSGHTHTTIYKISFRVIFKNLYVEDCADCIEFINKNFNLNCIDLGCYMPGRFIQTMRVPYTAKSLGHYMDKIRLLKLINFDGETITPIAFSDISLELFKEFLIQTPVKYKNIKKYEV